MKCTHSRGYTFHVDHYICMNCLATIDGPNYKQKEKPMKIRIIKKTFNGLVSLRDYEVESAIKEGGIIFKFGKYQMTLTPKQLQMGFSITNNTFKSKFGTKAYTLVDFRWNPDK